MEIPKLYAYIYRNILKTASNRRIIDSVTLIIAIRKVVMRAPRETMRNIILELEQLRMIKKVSKSHYAVILNKRLKKETRGLKPHVFPIEI